MYRIILGVVLSMQGFAWGMFRGVIMVCMIIAIFYFMDKKRNKK